MPVAVPKLSQVIDDPTLAAHLPRAACPAMMYQLEVALAAVHRRIGELDVEEHDAHEPAAAPTPGLYSLAEAAPVFRTTYDGLRKKLDRWPYSAMVVDDGTSRKWLSRAMVDAYTTTGRLPARPEPRLARGRR